MAGFEEFNDSRLVALYDTVCAFGADSEFFLGLVDELAPNVVLDVGCGTGLLTVEVARKGCRAIGVDPAHEMLEVARHRPDGHLVRWVHGQASEVTDAAADLAIMTAHVAQVIADDETWRQTLAGLARAVRPGGHLAFDSRDPRRIPWHSTLDATGDGYAGRTSFPHPDGGTFELWIDGNERDGKISRFDLRYRFDDGTELVSGNELAFRTQTELTDDLAGAGFVVREVFGDWDRRPVGPDTGEMIFLAQRQ